MGVVLILMPFPYLNFEIYMLSRHLMWERTPVEGVRASEQSALAGRREQQQLLICLSVRGASL
jgi:hypothetical protein